MKEAVFKSSGVRVEILFAWKNEIKIERETNIVVLLHKNSQLFSRLISDIEQNRKSLNQPSLEITGVLVTQIKYQ